MTGKIASTFLWDRLAFILGDQASALGLRPEKKKHLILDYDHRGYEKEMFTSRRLGGDAVYDEVEALVGNIKRFALDTAMGLSPDPRLSPFVVHRIYAAKFSYYEDCAERFQHSVEILYSATSDVDAIVGAMKHWIFLQNKAPDRYADLFSVFIREREIGPIAGNGDLAFVGGPLIFSWRADQTILSFDSTVLSQITEILMKKKSNENSDELG